MLINLKLGKLDRRITHLDKLIKIIINRICRALIKIWAKTKTHNMIKHKINNSIRIKFKTNLLA